VINRQKFKAIPDADLLTMFRSDELELCYLHMHSLQNLGIQLANAQASALAQGLAEPDATETMQ
jgi:hypothetical protein